MGVLDVIDGAGLESLGVVNSWNPEEDVLFKGGVKVIRRELEKVVRDCRAATSDADARKVLREYTKRKRCERGGAGVSVIRACFADVVLDQSATGPAFSVPITERNRGARFFPRTRSKTVIFCIYVCVCFFWW